MARQPGDSDFSNVNVSGVIKVNGTQVIGTQQSSIAFTAATTNATPEITNMSNALTAILTALDAHGLTA